ncbi:MAG: NAD(P)/FAD-dependent oxidoreductase, partial [bacterium]
TELRQNVILVEKNDALGKKLLLSGKGRCNITNADQLETFLDRFSSGGQFLRDAFKKFFNRGLVSFFESRGLKLKTERQNRIFPVTDRATSVKEILQEELKKNKVKVIYRAALKDLLLDKDKVKGIVLEDGRTIAANRVILATGGVSYSFTGSSGEGMNLAKKTGHRLVNFRPGLVALETREDYPQALEGLTLKNIRLKFTQHQPASAGFTGGQKKIISEIGELMFTAAGISGPLVLSLSGMVVDWMGAKKKVRVEIDLKPALSAEQVDARLLREFKLNQKKSLKNTLESLIPQKLIDVFIDISKIDPDKKTGEITRQERQKLVSLFKGLSLNIARPGPIEKAMVTRGGVSLKDINPRTMESRLIKSLYFAGEMIDVDADTGGFNLQAAFSTGYLAGESAAS